MLRPYRVDPFQYRRTVLLYHLHDLDTKLCKSAIPIFRSTVDIAPMCSLEARHKAAGIPVVIIQLVLHES
jgi:hypothetical protein